MGNITKSEFAVFFWFASLAISASFLFSTDIAEIQTLAAISFTILIVILLVLLLNLVVNKLPFKPIDISCVSFAGIFIMCAGVLFIGDPVIDTSIILFGLTLSIFGQYRFTEKSTETELESDIGNTQNEVGAEGEI